MATIRRMTKSETLVNLFDKVGKTMKLQHVLDITGIAGYNSLKAFCSYIRKSPSVPEESRIDIRIQGDTCIRVG